MRLQRIITAVVAAALLLSGCTSLSLNGPDILAPPKAAGHRAEVQRIMEKDAGGVYSLIYPASGSYKNGIILHDIDDNGTDEAVALYTAADGTPRLLIAVLQNDSYILSGSVALHTSNVSNLSFADCNADGREELIISFDAGSSLSSLKVYDIGEVISEVGAVEGFTDYVTGDFDGNSADDVLLFRPADSQSPAKASLMVYTEDGFSEKSSCQTDSDVLSYVNLRYDKLSEDIEGAVADGKLDSGQYTTQLLYYDSAAHMLINPLFQNSSYSESVRTPAVTCADIDGDGIIEIPLCSPMEHGKDEDSAAVCSLARWSGYDPELMALSFKQDAILCENLGFMLKFSREQLSGMTARCTADNAVTLYSVSYKDGEPVSDGELLTIKRYNKSSFDSSLTAQADLFESSAYTYTYILSEGSPFTHEDIENSFSLLEADSY